MFKRSYVWATIFRSSRRAFKNYPAVLMEYFMCRRILPWRAIRVECRSGGTRSLTPDELHKLLVGLRIGSVAGYNCEDNTVVLCNSTRAPLPEMLRIDLEAPLYGWRYNSMGFWELNGVRMKHVTTESLAF